MAIGNEISDFLQGVGSVTQMKQRQAALKQQKQSALFQMAIQLRGEQRAKEKHQIAMHRYTHDWEGVQQDLQIKRQTIAKNKQDVIKAQRDAQQLQITSAKTNASQIISLGRQRIKDIQDSTGNNTEYTKEQQLELKEARGQIAAGNDMLSTALTRQTGFNNPRTTPEQLAQLKQRLYLGLDNKAANITTSPLNQSNQNEIARGDALVKPEARARWVIAQSSGSMATIRGFLANENNVFNPTQQANARAAIAGLLAVAPQVRAQGDLESNQALSQGLLSQLSLISDVNLEANLKGAGIFKGLKIGVGEETEGRGTTEEAPKTTGKTSLGLIPGLGSLPPSTRALMNIDPNQPSRFQSPAPGPTVKPGELSDEELRKAFQDLLKKKL